MMMLVSALLFYSIAIFKPPSYKLHMNIAFSFFIYYDQDI